MPSTRCSTGRSRSTARPRGGRGTVRPPTLRSRTSPRETTSTAVPRAESSYCSRTVKAIPSTPARSRAHSAGNAATACSPFASGAAARRSSTATGSGRRPTDPIPPGEPPSPASRRRRGPGLRARSARRRLRLPRPPRGPRSDPPRGRLRAEPHAARALRRCRGASPARRITAGRPGELSRTGLDDAPLGRRACRNLAATSVWESRFWPKP